MSAGRASWSSKEGAFVFLGPSLPREEARLLLPDATFLPPASRGDVYRILPVARCIVLLDGVFHGTPSVWQRELLAAVEEGVIVIGAASMGALRAAELSGLGMRGCGLIFEWYKEGLIDGDDEVALLHAPEEFGWRSMSEPFVNIRYGLDAAVRAGLIAEADRVRVIREIADRHYAERTWRVVLDLLGRRGDGDDPDLEAFLASHDRKRQDARAALRLAQSELAVLERPASAGETTVPRVPPYPRSAFLFERIVSTDFRTSRGSVRGVDVLRAALADGARASTWRRELGRQALLESIVAPRTAGEARQRPALFAPAVSAAWLAANGLTRRSFEELHEAHAARAELSAEDGAVLADWADENGVTAPAGEVFQTWILSQDPSVFGLGWHFETALLLELQRTGQAARYAEIAAAAAVDGGNP